MKGCLFISRIAFEDLMFGTRTTQIVMKGITFNEVGYILANTLGDVVVCDMPMGGQVYPKLCRIMGVTMKPGWATIDEDRSVFTVTTKQNEMFYAQNIVVVQTDYEEFQYATAKVEKRRGGLRVKKS